MKTSNQNAQQCLDSLFSRYPVLESCEANIVSAYLLLYNTYKQGGKLLLAGNGGSAADAEHIVGELMKSFLFPRPILAEDAEMLTALFGKEGERLSGQLEGCLPAIPLTSMLALSTAFLNDVDPLVVFACVWLWLQRRCFSRYQYLGQLTEHLKRRNGGQSKEYADYWSYRPGWW